MRLATLRDGSPDGTLIVVGPTGGKFVRATPVARTLQSALDDWENARPGLEHLAARVEDGTAHAECLDPRLLTAPLPRAYEWVDGSAYLSHIALVRKARGAELPKTLRTEP